MNAKQQVQELFHSGKTMTQAIKVMKQNGFKANTIRNYYYQAKRTQLLPSSESKPKENLASLFTQILNTAALSDKQKVDVLLAIQK